MFVEVPNCCTQYADECYALDVEQGLWMPTDMRLDRGRYEAGSARITEDDWLIAGGYTAQGDTTSAEIFNVNTGKKVDDMVVELPRALVGPDVVSVDEYAFFVANTRANPDPPPEGIYLYLRENLEQEFFLYPMEPPPLGRRVGGVAGIATNSQGEKFLIVAGGRLEDVSQNVPGGNSTEIFNVGKNLPAL